MQTQVNPYQANHQIEPPASLASGKPKKTLAFKISLGLFCVGSIWLCLSSYWFFTGLLFVPFALGPLLINLSQTDYWRSKGSQAVLLFASIAYAVFFAYVYLVGIVWGTDAQSPIAVLFIGIYSLPVMVPLWIWAGILNWRSCCTRNFD